VRKLILIRHSLPEIVPEQPASQWWLSDAGRRRCANLAERLAPHDPAVLVSSLEPKAIETGQIVAAILGIPFKTAANLHEHERRNVGLFADSNQFQARVVSVFEHPGERILGEETADEAHVRFARAVAGLLEQHPGGNLAVVTHGTVMSLFVSRAARIAPAPFWKRLGLPAFAVLSLPGLGLLETVESVASET
jgi:broad specificity phosphatase PhoE